MKNTKKVLSIVLAVIMALGTLTIVAFAEHTYNPGVEDPNKTNVKLEVTQVPSVSNADGSKTVTAVDNDLYAVTVYAKVQGDNGLQLIWVPIKFDQTKFAVLMDYDGNYSYDDFYWDWFFSTTEVYSFPARFTDNHMYNGNDETVTAPKDAVATALGWTGNPKPGTITFKPDLKIDGVDGADAFTPDFTATDDRVLLCALKLTLGTTNVKSSLFNTVKGHLINNEYVDLFTVYFKRICTEEEAYGSTFGVATGSDFGTQCTLQPLAGAAGYNKQTAKDGEINYVANAEEAAIKPLVALTALNSAKSQAIAFNLDTAATPAYTQADVTSVDYRFVAQFSTTAFPIDYDATTGAINSTPIQEAGFILAKVGDATPDQMTGLTASQVAALSKDESTSGMRKCWTKKISDNMAGGSAFAFSCRIKGIAVTYNTATAKYEVASEYIAVPYIIAGGEVTVGQAMTSTAQAKYEANVGTFLAKKNG